MKTIARNAIDFAVLRTADDGNCVCVDKTGCFHRLVTAPGENPGLTFAGKSADE